MFVVLAVTLVGCGGAALSGPLIPEASLAARCKLGATQSSVLVTEWSAAEKANLEAMLGGGAVAVAFSGCEMQPLSQILLHTRRRATSIRWGRWSSSSLGSPEKSKSAS